jgi:hypothetical protein
VRSLSVSDELIGGKGGLVMVMMKRRKNGGSVKMRRERKNL